MGIPWHNQIFYYGIVAYDASGNRGLMSNTVSVIVIKEEDNEIIPETTTETSAALPQSALPKEIAVYVWAPILAIFLVFLAIGASWTMYRHSCPAKEYDCDDKSSWSHDESRSTTISAGVSTSTNLTMEDDLSVVDQKIVDTWSSGPSSLSGIEPRIHVMEDFTVYRDLSTISDVPSEYCRLDQMLSALLAAKQQHNESLV